MRFDFFPDKFFSPYFLLVCVSLLLYKLLQRDSLNFDLPRKQQQQQWEKILLQCLYVFDVTLFHWLTCYFWQAFNTTWVHGNWVERIFESRVEWINSMDDSINDDIDYSFNLFKFNFHKIVFKFHRIAYFLHLCVFECLFQSFFFANHDYYFAETIFIYV